MAATSRRLYESPKEQSFVDLLYDDLTLVATGIRAVSGTGLPFNLTITYAGVTTSRTYASGSDVTWLFVVPPAITLPLGDLLLPGFTAWSVQHATLTPSVAALPTL